MQLGDLYFRGEVVPQDLKKARLWYNTALLKGNPPAALMLGDFAYHGYDCEVNYAEAARYYIEAAPRFIDAFYRLGDMYLHGEYFPADPAFARELYDYVMTTEEKFYQKNGFYSDAHGQVSQRLDEMERNQEKYSADDGQETAEQLEIRRQLQEIMASKKGK